MEELCLNAHINMFIAGISWNYQISQDQIYRNSQWQAIAVASKGYIMIVCVVINLAMSLFGQT